MSTKKPNLNKEQWNQKWDKEPVRYKLDKSEEKEGPKPRKSSLTLNEPPRRTARSVSASKTAASADKSTASVPKKILQNKTNLQEEREPLKSKALFRRFFTVTENLRKTKTAKKSC